MNKYPNYLTRQEVADKLPCSLSSVSNRMRDGRLPAPITHPSGALLWLESDIDRFIACGWNMARYNA